MPNDGPDGKRHGPDHAAGLRGTVSGPYTLGVKRLAVVIVALACVLTCAPAAACPEIIVPVNPRDTVFKSAAWRRPMGHYRARRFGRALRALQKANTTLERETEQLFHAAEDRPAPSNRTIQRWLQKHVYTRNPGVLIRADRFTYPAVVWWAWADTACRAERYGEALIALRRLREVRDGSDLNYHEALVLLRLGRTDEARKLVPTAPPDGFMTPYLEGLIARADGDLETFRSKLTLALRSAALDDRRNAVRRALDSD